MKADWEEILDMWEEKELAYFLPECLLDMDDAIYQRIETDITKDSERTKPYKPKADCVGGDLPGSNFGYCGQRTHSGGF